TPTWKSRTSTSPRGGHTRRSIGRWPSSESRPATLRQCRHPSAIRGEGMESLHTPALALSMLAAALLTMGLLHIARRESFPGAEHGSLRISGRRMKWVWGIALLTAFIAGGPEILATTERSE